MNEMINLKLYDDIDPIHEDYFNPVNPRVPPSHILRDAFLGPFFT